MVEPQSKGEKGDGIERSGGKEESMGRGDRRGQGCINLNVLKPELSLDFQITPVRGENLLRLTLEVVGEIETLRLGNCPPPLFQGVGVGKKTLPDWSQKNQNKRRTESKRDLTSQGLGVGKSV